MWRGGRQRKFEQGAGAAGGEGEVLHAGSSGADNGSNVDPRRARPDLADLGPHAGVATETLVLEGD